MPKPLKIAAEPLENSFRILSELELIEVPKALIMTSGTPQTTLDALLLYIQSEETNLSGRAIANLKTALRRYILPALKGHSFSREALEGVGLDYGLSQIPLFTFINAEPRKVLEESCRQAVEAGALQPTIGRTTYRSPVNKFLTWIEQGQWYEEIVRTSSGRYAPRTRYGDNIMKSNRGRRAFHTTSYALKETELTPDLVQQLEDLHIFCTGEYVSKRQDKKMREITFKNHRTRALSFFGWLRTAENYEITDLDLTILADVSLLNKFLEWGINVQGNTCGWAQGFCESALNVLKWLHCHGSKRPMYRDIEAVDEVRMIINKLAERYAEQRKANKKAKLPEKEMTMEQCVEVIKYLRKCCAPRDSFGAKRSTLAVVHSWQRYLLVAILTYCPIRQRELRELELGRTLLRTLDGYRIVLQPEDNKTSDDRDFILSDILAPEVVVDLDEWLDVWRPTIKKATENLDEWLGFVNRRAYKTEAELDVYLKKLADKIQQVKQSDKSEGVEKLEKRVALIHKNVDALGRAQKNLHEDLFFISCGSSQMEGYGKPLAASSLFTMVTRAVYTTSSALKKSGHPLFVDIEPRKTNPHFFRNIATTHERRHGDPTKRKAFHKVLGNSEATGDKDYNEMHPGEKTVDAKDWWKSETLQGKSALIAQVKALLAKLPREERQQLLMESLQG